MKVFKTQEDKEAILAYYDTLTKKFTVPYEEKKLETRYGTTSVLIAGDYRSQPLMLLHGSSMNSTMWIQDINVLSRKYRVYAPDMPGEPGKSSEEQLSFDSPAYTEWLLDVMNGLKIVNPALIGASLGAWLATKFSVSYPHLISKLILLCPAGIGPQNHAFKEIALSLLSKGNVGVDELFTQINGGVKIPDLMLNYQKLIAATCNTRQEVIPMFTDEELQRLTMPSLLIVGAKDIMLNSLETAERFRALVPGAGIKILPQAGHSLTGLTADFMAFLDMVHIKK